ncbi:MAG: NAD(P)-dependent dehydrogenase (short-subunit alcohol dehydrogenase family) [Verrucomicrobiales bacterium]|jgi:NAD(P)-dependent dehydrogenase (short-subunit alcohol dehydrogenase family)
MKTALVTGAGSGLGAEIAVRLSELGFDVGVHFHSSREAAERVCERIESNGQRAFLLQANLGREAEVQKVRTEFEAEFSSLDLLVNNAGVYLAQDFYDQTEDDWFTELNSTATAVYFTTRALLPMLRQAKGRIINIGDGVCDHPGARTKSPAYHIGKTGVWILTRSIAKAEAEHGVAVNMISPGLLETSVGLDSEAAVPAGRFGKFDDISAALEFLAVHSTAYLTGSNLVIGGGWNL